MPISRLLGLALAAALLLTPLAGAQTPQVEITDVRVGFPGSINVAQHGGTKNVRFKMGAWAPIYVDVALKPDSPPLQRDTYVLVVESSDGEDLQNVYVERRFLPTIEVRESPTLLTYVRIGNLNSGLRVKVQQATPQADGSVKLGQVLREKHLSEVDLANPDLPHMYGYLTLGGRVKSLYKALVSTQQAPGAGGGMGAGGGIVGGAPQAPAGPADDPDQDKDVDENGNRFFAHLDQVQQMPTHWFGYQAIDTAILLTAKQQFATDLNAGGKDDPLSVRREALAEWVRRGGHLIISVSKNHQEVNQILEQMKIIDLAVEGRVQLAGLPGVARWAGLNEFRGIVTKDQKTPIFEVAKLKPGRAAQVLAYDKPVTDPAQPPPDAHPMIVQSPCGLGRVIVVGFDLDEQPFTGWKGREEFWKRIKEINEPSNVGDGLRQDRFNRWGGGDNQTGELGGKLVKSLESFPDVPVISFGWVALFILVYILIVGPLDYFFLKKVVKRLELTWITFPAVVIVISAIAYFAAYHLKGKDLRINKMDVVDVDVSGGNVYGSSWFTLFSPRIQNYTVGIEPGAGWGPEERDPKKYGPFVGWMSKPDDNVYAYGGHGPGLFRRAYDYAPESSGLIGVPIQVWSTKTFNASWARPIKEDELVESRLEVAKNDAEKMKLSGTITSHLPVDLRDAVLFYRGKFYPLDKLTAGTPLRVDGKMEQAGNAQTWFQQPLAQPNFQAANNRRGGGNQDLPQPYGTYIKSILFHAYPGDNTQQSARNSGLRFLDQKWRLDVNYRDEAIVFGRAEAPPGGADGNADEVSQSGLSASKLWLGKLPGAGDRPRIDGTMSQDTYVRLYLPVTTSK